MWLATTALHGSLITSARASAPPMPDRGPEENGPTNRRREITVRIPTSPSTRTISSTRGGDGYRGGPRESSLNSHGASVREHHATGACVGGHRALRDECRIDPHRA